MCEIEDKLLFRLHNTLNLIVIGPYFFQYLIIFKIVIGYNRIIFPFSLLNFMITQLLLRIESQIFKELFIIN